MTLTATRPVHAVVDDGITVDRRAVAPGVEVLHRGGYAPVGRALPTKRVAAYCRVSTDMEQQTSSLETQMAAFHGMIASHAGWELAGLYVDDGITATSTKKRVQFMRMIEDCEAGKIDLILTKSISRFARNTQDCLTYIRRLKELGVYIYFDDIRLDTGSASSEMMITILAAVAQEESRSISENIKLGMRMRFKAGKPKWVNTYGYAKGPDGEYHVNQEQAKGVRRIFELYVSGRSLPQIVRVLEAEGIPAMSGGRWWPKSLATVLHNEKYVGDVMMQKTYTVDHLTHRKVKNDHTVVPSYYVKDHHESIVDRLTFERVQTMLRLKDRHNGCVQYPYAGRLRCPCCGEAMIARADNGQRPAWICGGHAEADASAQGCAPDAIDTRTIDRAVLEAYGGLDERALEALVARLAGRTELSEADASVLDAARAALRWKAEIPQTVEYLFLDELVESITFREGSACVIVWKFGCTSCVPLHGDGSDEITSAGQGRVADEPRRPTT